MRNLEQTLAQTLLDQFKFCEQTAKRQESKPFDDSEYSFLLGEKIALKSIATAIWGEDITGQIPLEFIKNLEKIANSEPQANLVEVSRFEAFGLFKDYGAKSVKARHEGFEGLADTYSETSDKWLDIAVKIEQSNADGFNKDLMHI